MDAEVTITLNYNMSKKVAVFSSLFFETGPSLFLSLLSQSCCWGRWVWGSPGWIQRLSPTSGAAEAPAVLAMGSFGCERSRLSTGRQASPELAAVPRQSSPAGYREELLSAGSPGIWSQAGLEWDQDPVPPAGLGRV